MLKQLINWSFQVQRGSVGGRGGGGVGGVGGGGGGGVRGVGGGGVRKEYNPLPNRCAPPPLLTQTTTVSSPFIPKTTISSPFLPKTAISSYPSHSAGIGRGEVQKPDRPTSPPRVRSTPAKSSGSRPRWPPEPRSPETPTGVSDSPFGAATGSLVGSSGSLSKEAGRSLFNGASSTPIGAGRSLFSGASSTSTSGAGRSSSCYDPTPQRPAPPPPK